MKPFKLYKQKRKSFFRLIKWATITVCILWYYGLLSFQAGGTKLERFLLKNQHTQGKFLNFENWCYGELSKIGHHIYNKVT